jgi:hypothetical protein
MFIQNIEYLYFFIYIYTIYILTLTLSWNFLLSKYKFLIKLIKILFSFYLLSKNKSWNFKETNANKFSKNT